MQPYRFVEKLRPKHYKGLKRYAPYVLRLLHDDRTDSPKAASWVEAFLTNAQHALRTTDPIFPKLTTLRWHRSEVPLFSPDHLLHQDTINDIIGSRLASFIERVTPPGLQSLDIDALVLLPPRYDRFPRYSTNTLH